MGYKGETVVFACLCLWVNTPAPLLLLKLLSFADIGIQLF